MSSSSEEPEQITIERRLAAISWLKTFLTENSSATEAKSLTNQLDPSPTTILTIERLRDIVSTRTTSFNAVLTDTAKRTSEYKALYASWDLASVQELYNKLDADAISETVQLAHICSALGLSSSAREERLCALTELASRYLSIRDVISARRLALADAKAKLKEAAWHVAQARAVQNEVEIDVRERMEYAKIHEGKAERMMDKAQQYEQKAIEVREDVRASGVSRSTTHEAVVVKINELKDIEARMENVGGKVEKYRGLPAVRFFALMKC